MAAAGAFSPSMEAKVFMSVMSIGVGKLGLSPSNSLWLARAAAAGLIYAGYTGKLTYNLLANYGLMGGGAYYLYADYSITGFGSSPGI